MLNKELLLGNQVTSPKARITFTSRIGEVFVTVASEVATIVNTPLLVYAGGGIFSVDTWRPLDSSVTEGIVYVTNEFPSMTLPEPKAEMISMTFKPYTVPDVGPVKRVLISTNNAHAKYLDVIDKSYDMNIV